VILTKQGDDISLRMIPGAQMPAAVIATAGPITPGQRSTINLPTDLIDLAVQATADPSL